MVSAYRIGLREKSAFLSRLLHLADCASVVFLLWALTAGYSLSWSRNWSLLGLFIFLLCFVVFHSFQLYRSWRGKEYLREFVLILKSWATVVGILLFVFFITKEAEKYSRFVILSWFGLAPLLLFFTHFVMRKLLRNMRSKGFNIKNAVIVGANRLGTTFSKHIEEIPWAGVRVLGFFDDDQEDDYFRQYNKPLLGDIAGLPGFLSSQLVDYVYIALPLRAEVQIHSIIERCRTLGAQLLLVPDIYSFSLLHAEICSIGNMIVLDFNPEPRLKRYFDVCFSLAVLLLTLPLTLIIALLIKLEDRGPILYGHRRITTTGKVFKCLKFRTMFRNADQKLAEILENDPQAKEEWEKTFKLKNDPRVTWIGKFLRKTSLDELPQFINVLKGDMSVVGARPIVHKELCDYYKENGGLYCSMKPGITGPWQVSKRSDTEDYEERVQLDTWYVLNRSFWLDIKIICKTVVCMINGRGAY